MDTTPMILETRALLAQAHRSLDETDAFIERTLPLGRMRDGDLLVRIEAVSINPVDTKSRAGLRSGTKQLGWDASGVVEAVGAGVTSFRPGDEVWYAGELGRPGSNADHQLVDARLVGKKPRTIDHAQAAALPLTAITAWESLFERLRLRPDSTGTLLVIGAPGGVGSILIQLAKARTGLTVIGTAGRQASRDWVARMGADHIIDRHDLVAGVRGVAPEGVHYLFTAHSAGSIPSYAEVVRPFGEIVAIDDARGQDLYPLKRKSIAWHWELMFTKSGFQTADMGSQGALLSELADLVDAGRISTTATTTLRGLTPDNLRVAHGLVADGGAIGKVVVAR
jgi:zinc-binding alcohol dehydrogenase family protein